MNPRRFFIILGGIFAIWLFVSQLAAQEKPDYSTNDKQQSRTRAVDKSESRAEKEAERLVSLSPDKIILILQQEPGLFLEVKKMYVRRAFSQGQVIEAKNLSDDFIFRQVRDDQEFCALITQQIVDRGYIRPKPTHEELARQYEEQQELMDRAAREEAAEEQQFGQDERSLNRTSQFGAPASGTQFRGTPTTSPNIPYSPPNFQNTPSAPTNLNNNQQRQLMQ